MKCIFHDIDLINKIIGFLYILAALFYLIDWMVPFCMVIILAIVFLLFSIRNKSPSKTQVSSFNFREFGIAIFVVVMLIKMFI